MAQHLHTEPVHRKVWRSRVAGCLMAVLLAACGGGDPQDSAPPAATQQITVTGDDGASIDFTPAEGLAAAPLNITRAEAGAPALPADVVAAGAVYQFAPQGHVGSAIEILVPFTAAQPARSAPRLLVALAGDDSWSEVESQPDGAALRARVPTLGYAVAVRPLPEASAARATASTVQPAQSLRGQLSAVPPLQGSAFLRTARSPSTLTAAFDYAFAQTCASPVQLRLRAIVVRPPSSTQMLSVVTLDLGSRSLTARSGSERFDLPLTAAQNGTWAFLATARCVEQGRVRFSLLATLPVLVVKIPTAPPPPPTEGSATIGAAGGFVNGPDGVRLAIPPEALESDITFRIARNGSGAPPLPGGIELASAVYAITPHGQAFGVSASVELPVSAALAAGRPTFLMKAEPGGRWSVIGSGSAAETSLRAGIDSLSYLAVGVCQNNLPPGSPFSQACPSNHQLKLELLLNGSSPVPISQDTTYGAPIPVVLITTPETLTFRLTWTRPTGTNRVDSLDTGTSLSSNTLTRQSGFTFAPAAPRFLQVNENSFSRTFTVDVDPTRVSGATGPNGVVRRIWAQAAYSLIGPGNVGSADWEFNAWVPIQVRSLVPLPEISSQPANVGVVEGQPASFSVSASVAPAATLSYQWSRRAGASGSFAPIPGATSASYAIPATQLADDGAQFQVDVCAARCVTSSAATLTVTQAASAPSFTTAPANLAVVAGQTASFSATATGTPLPQVRWQSAAPGSSTFSDVIGVAACGANNPPGSGANVTATCTVGPVAVGDSGQRYRAVATNAASPGGVVSDVATLTVTPAAAAPVITQQPGAQTANVGGSATFSVAATGTAPLSYTWGTTAGGNLPSTSNSRLELPGIGCSALVTYSDGGATLTLSALTIGCNGLTVVVTVSNGINPSAAGNSVTLTVNQQAVTPGACFGGQSNWCYANPSPQAGSLSGLAYNASTSTFTAVGEAGTTLRTVDGGATWQLAFEAGRTGFSDVASPTAGLLVAAGLPPVGSGQNAGVFSSTDGGQTWTRRLDAGFPGQFAVTKLAFANASVGVAAGFRGVWRTVNGGLNWTPVNVPAADFLVGSFYGGVTWVNTNVVLIYGSAGKILRSADQGASWTDVSPAGFFEDWLDMAFNGAGVGVAAGPNGRVARSTDGGASWQELVTPMSERGTAVAFADSNTVVVMGNLGQTMRSTDAGTTWTVGFAFSASAVYRLRFANPNFGLAVSAINGLTLRTTDGGQTWTRIGGGTIDENVIGMAASPSGNVVLAGSLARDLLRSTDGGATWARPGFSLVGAQFQKPAFATEQRAIAIRPAGQIALSVDAGQTWNIADDRLGQVRLNDATMASPTSGLVVGDNGLILRSTDGGSNWAAVASGTSNQLRAVRCLTATVCVAAGGGVLRSTDSGATWAVLPSPGNGFGANAIARLSDSVAVIASSDGLWRTADAGLTWTRVYTPTGGSQLGVSFSSTGTGIAAGYDGILRSTDQGVTWAPQPVPAPSYLNAVTWVGTSIVLVGGDGGAILRNLQAGAP